METIKNVSLGVFHGIWDSIRGMTLVLYIDEEIHRLNAEKAAAQREQRHRRRSPSPVPSSAAAMARNEELGRLAGSSTTKHVENADERSLDSIRREAKAKNIIEEVKCEKKVAKQVIKCCMLNGGFTWLSIILFEQCLLPILKYVLTLCYGHHTEELHYVWGWLQSILSIIFGMMWILPIFLLSKIVSSLWFADIANAAYQVRKGQPQWGQSLSKLVADFLFSLVVQMLFLMQSMLVNTLPIYYIGKGLCFVHLCLLYSLYSFEYKWFNMGWELHRRLSYIENNWPYFLGFGIPLTLLTNMTDSVIVSSCIFSIFFPLFILSGNEAKPLVGTIETPLRLFSPVIFVSNLFFNRTGNRSKAAIQQQQQSKAKTQQKAQQHQNRATMMQQQQQHRHYGSSLRRHSSTSSTGSQQLSSSSMERHRYQQPPAIQPHLASSLRGLRSTHRRPSPSPSPMRITPERQIITGGGRSGGSGNYFGGGLRPLVPTPVVVSAATTNKTSATPAASGSLAH